MDAWEEGGREITPPLIREQAIWYIVEAELEQPAPVEETVRSLSAPDLITEAGPERVTRPGPVRGDPPKLVSGPRAVEAAG